VFKKVMKFKPRISAKVDQFRKVLENSFGRSTSALIVCLVIVIEVFSGRTKRHYDRPSSSGYAKCRETLDTMAWSLDPPGSDVDSSDAVNTGNVAGRLDVFVKTDFELVVRRHLVALAAFLMETTPKCICHERFGTTASFSPAKSP
jgi:hypothetical protein